jgi:arylsulfatase A-like enzyme
MKRRTLVALAVVSAAAAFTSESIAGAQPPRPNMVYFLVDDLGHTDVAFTGSKDIRTPNIDRLAKEGAVLDSFTYSRYVRPPVRP